MVKINLLLVKIACYQTGAVVATVRTGLKPTDFNVYILRDASTERPKLIHIWRNSDKMPVIRVGRFRVSFRRSWQKFHFETDLHYRYLNLGFVTFIYRGVSK